MFDLFGSEEQPEAESADNLRRSRERMVEDQLVGRGITDSSVLEAMREIPRHKFTDGNTRSAYEDRPLPIGRGQTISQPYMVAWMTELLELESHHEVLEIGTGSGYQTAVLAAITDHVYTIERHEELVENARMVLEHLGFDNISYRVGDGTLGWTEHAPYDREIVTAGAPAVPDSLLDQLSREKGTLVLPVGRSAGQTLMQITRDGDSYEREEHGNCVFVQLIGEEGW